MKHVIIGGGAAGIAAARAIREKQKNDEIVIIAKDEQVHSRCMLHKYIGGNRKQEELSFVPENFFDDKNIKLLSGVTLMEVDTKGKTVRHSGGETPYDKLLIATGAESIIPNIGGLKSGKNVVGLRDLSDAKAIRQKAASANNIVIIGAGLVGLDAAYGLMEMGKKPVVIEMAEQVLAVNLDASAASRYQQKFEESGTSFRLGKKVQDAVIDSTENIKTIVLDDGEQIACDMVIVAAGVKPTVAFLENSGITYDRSVDVNDYLATNIDGVYAAGDVAGLSGIWPNAVKQGEIAGLNMSGEKEAYEDTFAIKNTINFFNIAALSVGQLNANAGDVEYCREDKNIYQKVILRDGVPVGVVLYGDISNRGSWQHMIKNKVNISMVNKPVWKVSFADFYSIEPNGEYNWL